MGGRVLELEADRVMAKLQAHYNKGVETGKEEERDESARIFTYLKGAGRLDDYEKALRDKDLWGQLLQEAQNNA